MTGVWGLAMDRDDLSGTKNAFGFKIGYPNDLWDVAFTHKSLGDAFLPSLGFVPRPGVRITNFNVNYRPARSDRSSDCASGRCSTSSSTRS